MSKVKVVLVGGGNGTSMTARALHQYAKDLQIDAVVSVADSGRSSQTIRKQWRLPAVADIWRVLLALSGEQRHYAYLKELTYGRRFPEHASLQGLNIGSALLAGMAKQTGDLTTAIRAVESVLGCIGSVHPASLDIVNLCAKLSDGQVLVGEGHIDEPDQDITAEIDTLYMDPQPPLHPNAAKVLADADIILIGPGDLYTSNIAALLADGTQEAIAESTAKIVYIAGNKYTIGGEPAPTCLSRRVAALERYLPRGIDTVVYDSHRLTEAEAKHYQQKRWGLIDFDTENIAGKEIIGKDIEKKGGGISYKKLGHVLSTLWNSKQ